MTDRDDDRREQAAWRLFGIPALMVLAYIAWGLGMALWLHLTGAV